MRRRASVARSLPYKIVCHTKEGFITLVFFHARAEYLAESLPVGAQKVVSGKFERTIRWRRLSTPISSAAPEEFEKIQALEPVYPLTGGMTNRHLSKIVASALKMCLSCRMGGCRTCGTGRMAPMEDCAGRRTSDEGAEDVLPASSSRRRLAYDETACQSAALAFVRERLRRPTAAANCGKWRSACRALRIFRSGLRQGRKTCLPRSMRI